MTDTLFSPDRTPADRAATATRSIAYWLLFCAGMVFAMAIIGAITRLTESGLSITEWKPITGAIPPLNEAEWQAEFEKYKRIPEYQVLNRGMSLEEFKGIFFWEWFHRLWGRLIGVVFLVPFLWFLVTGRVSRALLPQLLGLFALGGLQGALGWYMVQSGLVERTDVSHYRLAAHLGAAILIYGALIWVALGLLNPIPTRHRTPDVPRLRRHGWAALALAGITIVWGAFVAGLDAGFAYNTWPLMNGEFLPPEVFNLTPLWLNLLENTAAVQFTHRWLAIAAALVIGALVWRIHRAAVAPHVRNIALGLGTAVSVQVLLGIASLVLAVPIPLGAAHQGGALVVVGLLIWTLHELRSGRG